MKVAVKEESNYLYWDKRRTPYLTGTRINARVLWVDYKTNKKDYSWRDFAEKRELPVEAIFEAFEWCSRHEDEVTLDCEEERRNTENLLR